MTRVAAVTGEGEPTATQRLQPTAALAGSLSSPGSPEVSAGEEAAETERQQLRDVRAAVSMLSTSRCYREPDIRGLRAAALFQLRALALRWEQEVVLRMTSVDVPSVAGGAVVLCIVRGRTPVMAEPREVDSRGRPVMLL